MTSFIASIPDRISLLSRIYDIATDVVSLKSQMTCLIEENYAD